VRGTPVLCEFLGALADAGGGEVCQANLAITRTAHHVTVATERHELALQHRTWIEQETPQCDETSFSTI